MKIIRHFWHNLKTETDIWFFYLFLLTLPFSIRKVITFYPIRGQFNEYTGIYLYLSDIFLILTLFSWIIILCHKYSILSIHKITLINRHNLWTRLYPQFSPQHLLAYLSLVLIVWSFLSILWSDNQIIALFRSLKLLELFLLALYVTYRIIPNTKNTKCSTWNILDPHPENLAEAKTSNANPNVPRLPREMFHVEHSHWDGIFDIQEATKTIRDLFKLIILGGLINSFIGIWQFISQTSLGLTFFKESLLSPNIDGAAKIVVFGQKLIRAYGFFPHPNVLGGFLLLTIILTSYYLQMFHVEHSNSIERNVPRGTFSSWKWVILAIQIVALILTFSKSALIGLFIALAYINVPRGTFSSYPESTFRSKIEHLEKQLALLTQKIFGFFQSWQPGDKSNDSEGNKNNIEILQPNANVPRRTFTESLTKKNKTWRKMFHVEHLLKSILITFLGLFVAISIFPNLSPIHSPSLDQREMLSIVPRGTIANNPILGVGQGQLIWSMRHNPDLLDWQFQPVHNVFLLIWSELGIVGLILFAWLLWKMFHVEHLSGFKKQGVFTSGNLTTELKIPTQNVPRGTLTGKLNIQTNLETIFRGLLLGFIFIMLFDHYLWDIQQGQLLLWMVIGFVYGMTLVGKCSSDDISLSN